MQQYQEMTKEELVKEQQDLQAAYQKWKEKGLNLDMSRGKPSTEQLDLTMGMFDILHSKESLIDDAGIDCRNYGELQGIEEARILMGEMIECPPKDVVIYGNSSLQVMYDTISRSMTHGVLGSTPWSKLDKVKFLCPVPGYDRHFAICEYFGIEMINVPMLSSGPDMDLVEQLVQGDDSIKGIWCVPKYSNPQGITYSDETVHRFAQLKPAAKDFRIYWDNAYGVHHLYEYDQDYLLEILEECRKAGNPDLVIKFCSTSKIAFPGGGIAALAASPANVAEIVKQLGVATIGYDKLNQLRQIRYFKNLDGINEHMRKHAFILQPKFDLVYNYLTSELDKLGIGYWNHAKGGYFICFEALTGCAKAIVSLAKEAGLSMTPAGAPYPYGQDPKDSIIRIAPTYPTLAELKEAIKLFVVCVKLVSVTKILETK
jgi:DNA-binding transcriptional MocR family regulator